MNITDIVALAGSVIGSAGGASGTYLGLRSRKDGLRTRSEDQRATSATELSDGFKALSAAVIDAPEDPAAWNRSLSKARTHVLHLIGSVRDAEVHTRLSDLITCTEALDNVFFRVEPETVYRALDHAAECIGAWRNGEPVPAPTRACRDVERAMWHEWDIYGDDRPDLFGSGAERCRPSVYMAEPRPQLLG